MPNFPDVGYSPEHAAFLAIVDPNTVTHPLPDTGQTPWDETFRLWAGDVEGSILTLEGDVVDLTDGLAETDATVALLQSQIIGGGRVTASYTTASLAPAAREQGVVAMALGWQLIKVQASAAARIRLYDTTANRGLDATRAVGVDPDPLQDHGVMLDVLLLAAGSKTLSPQAFGNLPSGTNVPITVDNKGATATAVTVTLTYLRTE